MTELEIEVPSMADLYGIYYAVPPQYRQRAEWRMSAAMLELLGTVYAPKGDDDDDDEPRTDLPALLFDKRIVVDERYPQPKLVEAAERGVAILGLNRRDAEQLESALRNRGDHQNADPAWRRLAETISAIAEGFRAQPEEGSAP